MSNQTFIKKDRISFATNLIEKTVIAPNSNAIFIGANSSVIYDGNSNVISINPLQGITLSNQFIYATDLIVCIHLLKGIYYRTFPDSMLTWHYLVR